MKSFLFVISLIFLIIQNQKIGSNFQIEEREVVQNIDTIPLGYLNRDRIADTAFVIGPRMINQTDTDTGECLNNNCKVTIRFSCNIPPIELQDAIGGKVEMLGDINGDGNAELVVVPWWFISCWGKMHFYTMSSARWREFGSADCDVCREEPYLSLIKPEKGKLEVLSYEWDENLADRKWKSKMIYL